MCISLQDRLTQDLDKHFISKHYWCISIKQTVQHVQDRPTGMYDVNVRHIFKIVLYF